MISLSREIAVDLTRILVTTTLVTRDLVGGVNMLNPKLTEMMASDRIRELQRTSAQGSWRGRYSVANESAVSRRTSRHDRLIDSQRVIGWFLVSIGLRLVVPRTRTGSVR
jgi:hypothetical protein